MNLSYYTILSISWFFPEKKQFCQLLFVSRIVLWKAFIGKHGGVLSNSLDLSSLTKVSDGYTAGQILSAVKEVLTERRVSQQQAKPLQAFEFIPGLARSDPIYKEEEEAYKKWWSKTPLGIKRSKATAEEEDGGKAATKGKGKGKGGKWSSPSRAIINLLSFFFFWFLLCSFFVFINKRVLRATWTVSFFLDEV